MTDAELADQLRRTRRVFMVCHFLRWLPAGLLLPVLVLVLTERGLSLTQVGFVFATYGAVTALLELPTGALADTLGRKPVLLLATVFDVGLLVGLLFSQHTWQFMIAATAGGVGRALLSGPLESWYVDAARQLDPAVELRPALSGAGVAESAAIGVGAVLSAVLPTAASGLPLDGVVSMLTIPLLAGLLAQGASFLAILLLVEFMLERPESWAIAMGRFSSAPLFIVSDFVRCAITPAVAGCATGSVVHYAARAKKIPIDIDCGAALVALAWFPHTFWLAISVLVSSFGFSHPLMPHESALALLERGEIWQFAAAAIELAPFIVYGAIVLNHAFAPSRPLDSASRVQTERLLPYALIGLIAIAIGLNANHLRENWAALRPLEVGDQLPPVILNGLEGQELALDSLRGQVVLVDFWATWCEPCRRTLPMLDEVRTRFADAPFRLVSVNVEPGHEEEVRAYLDDHDLGFEVHTDSGELQRRLHVDTLPTALLVDGEGIIRAHHVGIFDADGIRGSIQSLLALPPSMP